MQRKEARKIIEHYIDGRRPAHPHFVDAIEVLATSNKKSCGELLKKLFYQERVQSMSLDHGLNKIVSSLADIDTVNSHDALAAIFNPRGTSQMTKKVLDRTLLLAKSDSDSARSAIGIAFQYGADRRASKEVQKKLVIILAQSDTKSAVHALDRIFRNVDRSHGIGFSVITHSVGTGTALTGYYLSTGVPGRGKLIGISAKCRMFGGEDPIRTIEENIGVHNEAVEPTEWKKHRSNIPKWRKEVVHELHRLKSRAVVR